MKNQVNIANFQQKFVIKVDKKIAQIIPVAQRRMLTQAYIKLFSGFAWINWTQRHSLGRAWQTALNQCASMVATKNKKNPAAKYLSNVSDAHKKYMSQIIMLSPNNENTIDNNEQHIKKMRAHGQKMVKEAMDTINLILAQYNEYTETIEAQQEQQQIREQQRTQPVKEQQQAQKALPQHQVQAKMLQQPKTQQMTQPQKQQVANHKASFVAGQAKVKMLHVKLRVFSVAKFQQFNRGQQRA